MLLLDLFSSRIAQHGFLRRHVALVVSSMAVNSCPFLDVSLPLKKNNLVTSPLGSNLASREGIWGGEDIMVPSPNLRKQQVCHGAWRG